MWLLNTSTYKLEHHLVPPAQLEWVMDDHDTTDPNALGRWVHGSRYAILSHTWADEEVTFDDMQDLSRARKLKGFKKIDLTCTQARKDGLPYAWVDTCCIDKRSSAELSEAINSMFKWYQKASVCYVFLSDFHWQESETVRPASAPEDSKLEEMLLRITSLGEGRKSQKDSDRLAAQLQVCKWFGKGWTLQELIAPETIRFFDTRWREFGTKRTLMQTLADITGIEIHILESAKYLRYTSIAQKLSWAANRETSREEDQAYSMLGLLNVNMPLLYGEGPKAFVRLQEQIMRQSQDHSLFVWTPQLPSDRSSL